ncbi:metal-dependent transcriptional regulator [Halopiger aswanensis]|uniref:DtxR family iron (Metal) dependent repressor n=1 Tax=Halopiger aswanensis TaxID=148449 RepID=A0A419VZK9_9EURY|nr:DtxR family iron (metal) dependent repressor [Halopiger aswanensis]
MSATRQSGRGCSCIHPETCIDRHQGRYLIAVYRLTRSHDERVRTGTVSDRLEVSPASVTEMFDRLESEGLVDYEKQKGVTVTARGEKVARELVRRQRVVRAFFDSELGITLSPETGYRIGFVLPDEGIDRLRKLVDDSSGYTRSDE